MTHSGVASSLHVCSLALWSCYECFWVPMVKAATAKAGTTMRFALSEGKGHSLVRLIPKQLATSRKVCAYRGRSVALSIGKTQNERLR